MTSFYIDGHKDTEVYIIVAVIGVRDEIIRYLREWNMVEDKDYCYLHNAEIGEGCVVGASSVVKIKTDNNCILAGNPAKVIQTNHTWDRRRDIKFEDL